MSARTVVGVFLTGTEAARAAADIEQEQLGAVTTYAPTADHAVLDSRSRPTSPIRTFVLTGGLLGCLIGIALPIYTMVDWPLIVGGKPLISIPPLVIIGFELTMLGAALGGFAGFLVLSGLPRIRRPFSELRFTDDRFGVAVTCAAARQAEVESRLRQAGAESIDAGEGSHG